VNIEAGDDVTCTFTNTRDTGKLEVRKDVVPVDPQKGDPGLFNLTADGPGTDLSATDVADGGTTGAGGSTVDTGDWVIGESAGTGTNLDEYDRSLKCWDRGDGDETALPLTDDAVTVSKDDDIVCEWTNTRLKGDVSLAKVVVSVDPLKGDPGLFDLTIDGAGDAYDVTKENVADGGTTGTQSVPTGQFTLSEGAGDSTDLDDYVSTWECVNKGDEQTKETGTGTSIQLTVAAGDSWSCTITNTRKKGTVTLKKTVVPVDPQKGDPGRFDLTIDGEGSYDKTAENQGDGGSVTLEVPTGPVDLSEAGGDDPATALGDYRTTYECVDATVRDEGQVDRQALQQVALTGDGTSIDDLLVGENESWECTFTNTRKSGTIELVKDLLPENDTGRFNLTIDGDNDAYDATKQEVGDGGTTGTVEVPTGTYLVSESAFGETKLSDYVTGQAVCEPKVEEDRLQPASRKLRANDPNATSAGNNEVTVGEGENWICVITNKRVALGVEKTHQETGTDSRVVYNGDTLNFVYKITNTGGEPLTPASENPVVDDKCTGPVNGPTGDDGNDGILSAGETWTYTCSYPAPTTEKGAADLVNTVTVTFRDTQKDTIEAKDTATTVFRHPAIKIAKTGPASATAGDLLTYTLTVTNPGDTVFEEGLVKVTDPLCQQPPVNVSKGGDGTPGQLDPGDTWTYTCQVQSQLGQSQVVNTGQVDGTDRGGKTVTSSSQATTVLVQPSGGVQPTPPSVGATGRARLSGTVGCATSKWAKATVAGSSIKQVTFYVNGRKVRTLTKPNVGRTYQLRYRVKSLRYGAYKVRAKVDFVAGVTPSSRNLRLQFSRCQPRVVKPKFTG
jgi:uncharacterized repeat protein (TIGR01451 family)